MRYKVIWMDHSIPPPPAAAALTCSHPVLVRIVGDGYDRLGEACYNHRLKKWIILDDPANTERVEYYMPTEPRNPALN